MLPSEAKMSDGHHVKITRNDKKPCWNSWNAWSRAWIRLAFLVIALILMDQIWLKIHQINEKDLRNWIFNIVNLPGCDRQRPKCPTAVMVKYCEMTYLCICIILFFSFFTTERGPGMIPRWFKRKKNFVTPETGRKPETGNRTEGQTDVIVEIVM